MTDSHLMAADCTHGVPWFACRKCDLLDAMSLCRDNGIDPIPIMVEELRALGWEVRAPSSPETQGEGGTPVEG